MSKVSRSNWSFAAALLAVALGASTVRAAGVLTPSEGGAPLAIQDHEVHVDINNAVAVTEVIQVFRNDGPEPLEAVYSFPLPSGASLAGFSMWINGREMVGEVLERTRAREIYEEIVHPTVQTREELEADRAREAKIKDPGLVEEVSYREFQVTIFPVPAEGTQKVRLVYYQYLDVERDLVTYVYPLETRVIEDSRARGRLAIDVTLRSTVAISGFDFPTQVEETIRTEAVSAHRVQAYLERADADLDRDFVMTYRLAREATGLDVVAYGAAGEDGYFLLMATAPFAEARTVTDPVDYTFVVDVSGSMRRQRKLKLAGEAIARFLESCGPADRFNVIAFNVAPEALSATPLSNDDAGREELRRFLSRYPGVGGTDLYPALELAYAQAGPDTAHAVVVVSDGGLNDLDENHGRFLELVREASATVFGLAVGNEANIPLLEALAAETGGFVTQISSQDDLDRRGLLLRERMRLEPWKQLELDVEGVEVLDVVPTRIRSLYPGRQVSIVGRYRGRAPATFRLSGFRGARPVTLETRADLSAASRLNPEIRRMWAERRAHELLQGMRAGRLPASSRDAVIALGERYSIVTPFTSFLVLETDEMFERYGIERRTHALLEEETQARHERARAIDAETGRVRSAAAPERGGLDLGGALDPAWSGLIVLLLAGQGLTRRKQS